MDWVMSVIVCSPSLCQAAGDLCCLCELIVGGELRSFPAQGSVQGTLPCVLHISAVCTTLETPCWFKSLLKLLWIPEFGGDHHSALLVH
eukprot:1395526-Amphidinium_carterae.2